MASGGEDRTPAIEWQDEAKTNCCKVTHHIEGLNKAMLTGKPNATIDVNFPPECDTTYSLSVALKSSPPVKFKYEVKQLPGPVHIESKKFEIKKGQLILYLKKKNPGSWIGKLDANGLDQADE